jgi:hypothetical protein
LQLEQFDKSLCSDFVVGCGAYTVDPAMSVNQNSNKVCRFFTALSMARTIEYCLLGSAITIAGLLIVQGLSRSVMPSDRESAMPRSNHVPEVITSLKEFRSAALRSVTQ